MVRDISSAESKHGAAVVVVVMFSAADHISTSMGINGASSVVSAQFAADVDTVAVSVIASSVIVVQPGAVVIVPVLLLVCQLPTLHLLHDHGVFLKGMGFVMHGCFGHLLNPVHFFRHFFVSVVFSLNLSLQLGPAHSVLVTTAHVVAQPGNFFLIRTFFLHHLDTLSSVCSLLGRPCHYLYCAWNVPVLMITLISMFNVLLCVMALSTTTVKVIP